MGWGCSRSCYAGEVTFKMAGLGWGGVNARPTKYVMVFHVSMEIETTVAEAVGAVAKKASRYNGGQKRTLVFQNVFLWTRPANGFRGNDIESNGKHGTVFTSIS